MRDYIWMNITPGTRMARNGKVNTNVRATGQWEIALKNHIRVTHGGKEPEKCAACKELRTKLLESTRK